MKNFFELEAKTDLSKLMYKGIWVYPVLKQNIVFPVVIKGSGNKDYPSLSKLAIIFKILQDVFYFYLRKPPKGAYDLLIAENTQNRRFKVNNKSFSVYGDSFTSLLNIDRAIFIERGRPVKPYYTPKPYSKNILHEDFLIDLLLFRKKFKKARINTELFVDAFLRLGIKVTGKEIRNILIKFELLQSHYLRILKKYKPKKVLVICSYDYRQMALSSVCKKLKIPVFEIQHGHISETSIGYILKQKHDNQLFPDYFFAYGDYYKKLLVNNSKYFDPDQILVTGSVFMDYFLKNVKSDSEQIQLNTTKLNILITSQFTVREHIRDFAIGLAKKLPDNYHIYLKPHPGEPNPDDFYREFDQHGNIELLKGNQNILLLLKQTKIHATCYSTSAFEAAFLKVPTVFIGVDSYRNNYSEIADNKVFSVARTVDDFLLHLKRLKEIQPTEQDFKQTPEFFAFKVLEKLQKAYLKM